MPNNLLFDLIDGFEFFNFFFISLIARVFVFFQLSLPFQEGTTAMNIRTSWLYNISIAHVLVFCNL